MTDTTKRILILISVCLNLGFIIIAGVGYLSHSFSDSRHLPRSLRHIKVFDRLSLSPNQQTKIDQLVKEHLEKMGKVQGRVTAEKLAFLSLLELTARSEKDRLEAHIERIQRLEQDKEDVKLRHLVEIREVLTDEQSRKFFGMIAEHIKKRRP